MARADVRWEDQEKINRFSYISTQCKELEAEAKTKEENLSSYQDAMDEIELLMGDPVRILVGESLVQVTDEEATGRLEGLKEQRRNELEGIRAKIEEYQKEMNSLKSHLYAKFGTNINLEE